MVALKAVEKVVKGVPSSCQQNVEASLRPEFDSLERRFQAQFDSLNARVNTIDFRTEKLNEEMASMRVATDEMRKELALASKVPPPPKPSSAGFQREVDATVLKIVALTI
eukprot:3039422-Pyramimonas_sp.AAC.1